MKKTKNPFRYFYFKFYQVHTGMDFVTCISSMHSLMIKPSASAVKAPKCLNWSSARNGSYLIHHCIFCNISQCFNAWQIVVIHQMLIQLFFFFFGFEEAKINSIILEIRYNCYENASSLTVGHCCSFIHSTNTC